MKKQSWGFYGRKEELAQLRNILQRKRWFFLKVAGRRRIGKTSLVKEAQAFDDKRPLVYIQIPDSDPSGVLSTVRDFYDMFGIKKFELKDLRSFAASIGTLIEEGNIVAIDEFQYFHRQALSEFASHLQYEVDRITRRADKVKGGLIVLGSIHTEMAALLEDRGAPLFNRITDEMELPHLDIASIMEILRTHADTTPERLLFLWNLFEGIPKFYRDCYEQDTLAATRSDLLKKMFFTSSSSLRNEAENWFLRELRGRYDLVLKYVAAHPGSSHSDLMAHLLTTGSGSDKQIAGYIKVLRDRYRMIERLQPIFAKEKERNGRFYVRDNFLRSWLAALSVPVASTNFKPLDPLVEEADRRLAEIEGHGLERLAHTLYEERSRKAVGDFSLTKNISGYWDKAGTEIDLIALNEDDKVIRFGSCKRDAGKLIGGLSLFDGHIERFLERKQSEFGSWKKEKVAISPRLDAEHRKAIERKGYIPQDLNDLSAELN